jgi:hypothetical protein
MTMLEAMQRAVGSKDIIVFDDVRSVLRIGPTPMRNSGDWNATHAGLLAQFIKVVRNLYSSSWYRSPVSLTMAQNKGEETKQLEFLIPQKESTMSVLGLFRQFLSSDRLFVHSCNTYKRFCSSQEKVIWIDFHQKRFNGLLKDQPGFPSFPLDRSKLLEIFIYGINAFHSKSENNAEKELLELLQIHGQPKVLMAINSSLIDILGVAVQIFHVLKQDFDAWIADGADGGISVDLDQLFKSDNSPAIKLR